MTAVESVKSLLLAIYNVPVELLGYLGVSEQQSKYVIIIAIVAICVISYILYERNKRRKKSVEIRNIIREMKDAVRKSVETLDSRTQWVFQEDDELAPARKVYKKLLELEEKWDWTLTGHYEKNKDGMEDAMALITQWVEKKPNYDTKTQYLRDMAKVGDILKRW